MIDQVRNQPSEMDFMTFEKMVGYFVEKYPETPLDVDGFAEKDIDDDHPFITDIDWWGHTISGKPDNTPEV